MTRDLREILEQAVPNTVTPPDLEQLEADVARRRTTRLAAGGVAVAALVAVAVGLRPTQEPPVIAPVEDRSETVEDQEPAPEPELVIPFEAAPGRTSFADVSSGPPTNGLTKTWTVEPGAYGLRLLGPGLLMNVRDPIILLQGREMLVRLSSADLPEGAEVVISRIETVVAPAQVGDTAAFERDVPLETMAVPADLGAWLGELPQVEVVADGSGLSRIGGFRWWDVRVDATAGPTADCPVPGDQQAFPCRVLLQPCGSQCVVPFGYRYQDDDRATGFDASQFVRVVQFTDWANLVLYSLEEVPDGPAAALALTLADDAFAPA